MYSDDELPRYSKNEELFNMISHLVGMIMGLVVTIITILDSHSKYGLLSGIIFGFSMILLYLVSSTYHGLPREKLREKKIFRIIDHCSIFVLIAGSCTPFILCVLRKVDGEVGWIFYVIIWCAAILGVILNTVNRKKFEALSMVLYIVMGGSLFIEVHALQSFLGNNGFSMLIAGGAAYCIGIIFYKMGSKIPWMHSVFHIFCIIGSVFHCICICGYVI